MAFSNYAITVFLLFATLTILVSGRPRFARQENRKRGKKLPVSYQKRQKLLICKDSHTMFNCERSLKRKMIHSNLSKFRSLKININANINC